MTDEKIDYVVWEEAGFNFHGDGIYAEDFGTRIKLVDDDEYDENWRYYYTKYRRGNQ